MARRLRAYRPTHATVVAYLALFMAMGGTAYAAATIGSAQVVDNSLQSRDLKNNAAVSGADVVPNSLTSGDVSGLTSADVSGLTGADVTDNSLLSADVADLTGADVTDNSLKGEDIDESSLSGRVPRAEDADRADTVAASSVGSLGVINNSLTGDDIQAGAIQSRHIGAGQVTGDKLAANARDACPSSVGRFGRICAGSPDNPGTFVEATNYCAGLGLRLPSTSEAAALGQGHDVPGVTGNEAFWTDNRFLRPSNDGINAFIEFESGTSQFTHSDMFADRETVCVTTPST